MVGKGTAKAAGLVGQALVDQMATEENTVASVELHRHPVFLGVWVPIALGRGVVLVLILVGARPNDAALV